MQAIHRQSNSSVILLAIVVLLVLQGAASVFAAQTVGGIMATPEGKVAATPISIPRPINLEKMAQTSNLQQLNSTVIMDNITAAPDMQEAIVGCELIALQGKEITLRLRYRIHPTRPQPIYAGAWLYNSSGQPIDAGYKPVAIKSSPRGSVDVILVLPDRDFSSDYVMTFLMESGRPVFLNGRFKMTYAWRNGSLSGPGLAQPVVAGTFAEAVPQSASAFCKEYARTALAQYHFAKAHNLPGIVPPVWSGDYTSHYNWCLGASKENARQGTALRQGHLDRYTQLDQNKSSGQVVPKTPGAVTVPAVGKAMVIKPVPNKQFDPGRGP